MTPRRNAAAELRSLIDHLRAAGETRLPAERTLAGDLGLPRAALRRAMAELEAAGEIWRHVGRGTFVGRRPPVAGKLEVIADATNPAEIMEVRRLLEPSVARVAALRVAPGELEQLRECLRKSEQAPSIEAFELWDGQLHRTIAAAARNALLLSLFDAVNSVRGQVAWGRLKAKALTPERRRLYAQQHRALVQAIAERDGAAAEQAMAEHLRAVEAHMAGAVEGD